MSSAVLGICGLGVVTVIWAVASSDSLSSRALLGQLSYRIFAYLIGLGVGLLIASTS